MAGILAEYGDLHLLSHIWMASFYPVATFAMPHSVSWPRTGLVWPTGARAIYRQDIREALDRARLSLFPRPGAADQPEDGCVQSSEWPAVDEIGTYDRPCSLKCEQRRHLLRRQLHHSLRARRCPLIPDSTAGALGKYDLAFHQPASPAPRGHRSLFKSLGKWATPIINGARLTVSCARVVVTFHLAALGLGTAGDAWLRLSNKKSASLLLPPAALACRRAGGHDDAQKLLSAGPNWAVCFHPGSAKRPTVLTSNDGFSSTLIPHCPPNKGALRDISQ